MQDVDKMVVVTTTAGEKLIGLVDGTGNPNEKIRLCVSEGQPVDLTEVRSFIHIRDPKVDQQGRIIGMPSFLAFMPMDMFMEPAKKISVMISSWYLVCDNPSIRRQVTELLNAVEKNEKINAAQAAGLHIPGRS